MTHEDPSIETRFEAPSVPPRASLGVRALRASVDPLVALLLAGGYLALLLGTARSLGYARDEGFYFQAADSYAGWFRLLAKDPAAAIEQANVDRYWRVNSEHPALVKSLFAFSKMFLHDRLHLFREEGTSYRFPGMLLASLAVGTVYLWGARAIGRIPGLFAAFALAMIPSVFYHSHLDCFDMPVCAMWLFTAYAYWRSDESKSVLWGLWTGVLYGLLLDTKHNAWLFPGAVVFHIVVTRGTRMLRELRAGHLSVPVALVAMVTLGPLVFWVSWPWLWFETGKRFADYVAFHTGHTYYNMEFLGETYWKAPMPRLYAWLMTVATVPAITLLLFVVGLGVSTWEIGARRVGASARSDRGLFSSLVLWFVCILASYAPWLSKATPIFGGTKHWITAYPFLALFAALGLSRVLGALRTVWGLRGTTRRLVDFATLACVVAAPAAITLHSHPWGLSAYTPIVGGAPGGATLGLNRTFWGYTTGSLEGFLNDRSPRGARVYLHDTAAQSFNMMTDDGRLRRDLRGTLSIDDSDVALYHYEPHMGIVEYQVWIDYGTTTPAAIGDFDGVPVVWAYLRPTEDGQPPK